MSGEQEGQEGQAVDVEKSARAMGWVAQEEWKGNPDHWVDAAEYVDRGEKLMPLLRENNKRLQKELLTRDQKLDTLERKLTGATVALEKLEKHYTEANKRAVQIAKNELKEELKKAREDQDVDAEFDVLDKLEKIRKSEEAPAAPPEKKNTPADSALSEEFTSWQAENPWFGEDKKKTKAVVRIAEDLRDEGSDLTGSAFMEECVRIYEEQQDPEQPRVPVSKVDSSANRRPPSSSSSKSFASLPADAKAACHNDAEDLVGPDRRYKTMKDWENAYASIYYGEG
jgi:hypothetical protein